MRGRAHVPAIAVRARGRLVGAGTRLPASHRILLFVVLMGAASVVVYGLLLVGRMAPFVSPPLPWPVLAVGFCIAEMKVVAVHFRRESHSFSLSEFPAVIGLFFLSPMDYLLALLLGSGVALVVAERQARAKLAFNLSSMALSGVVALAVFHAIVTLDASLEPIDWAAAFGASLASTVVGALTTATVITISGGAPQYEKLPEMLQFGGTVAIANTSLALLAVSLFL